MADKRSPEHKKDLSRRKILLAGGATIAAVGTGGTLAANGAFASDTKGSASTAEASAGETCYRLTSENTEGPYYLDLDIFRKDITEGKEGIPLTLQLKVIDAETCKPLRDAAVDIWHCDAMGIYAGYESASGTAGDGSPRPSGSPTGAPSGDRTIHQEPTDNKTYLRGTQRTDKHGYVEFKTILPGWYQGRCVHIHTKVHVDGKWNSDREYVGGHVCHTGQFYFDQDLVEASRKYAPYSGNDTEMTTLSQDIIYDGKGAEGGLLDIRHVPERKLDKGLVGSLTMGVAPNETNDNDTMDSMPMPSGAAPSSS
ncbi:intradiol ring-cleavage dioxygenase [Streptomyces sp. SDT5-1]|uniref:intradiol ring-cleavage dioxygenase n=1 Tax=Streptomyces sp. SDT5-1 TaxID=3406418 RepID=UPI003FD2336C